MLHMENEELKKEKSELMNKVIDLGLPSNVISELKDAEAKIRHLEENLNISHDEIIASRQEINDLRKDNNLLRQEILLLKQELKDQQKQLNDQAAIIKRLHESFEVENRSAIRVLVRDAKEKNKVDKNIYSGSEIKLLYNQVFTQHQNDSAHVVSLSRIKTAINAKAEKNRRDCLLRIFEKTYPDYQELKSEDGDEWNELDDEIIDASRS